MLSGRTSMFLLTLHSLRKVPVLVIVKPCEPSCLHTAYSVSVVFNEKDSLVS